MYAHCTLYKYTSGSLGKVGASVREEELDGLGGMMQLLLVHHLLQVGQVMVHEDIVGPQQVPHHMDHWQLAQK